MTFLETNRLRLRNVSPKDAIQMVDYRNNERCSKYQRGQTKDYKDIVALIERNKDNALNIASPTMISVALRDTLMTIYSEINIAKQLLKIFSAYEKRISALEK